jgi:hypothetical protein
VDGACLLGSVVEVEDGGAEGGIYRMRKVFYSDWNVPRDASVSDCLIDTRALLSLARGRTGTVRFQKNREVISGTWKSWKRSLRVLPRCLTHVECGSELSPAMLCATAIWY